MHTDVNWTPFGQHVVDFIQKNKPRPGNSTKEAERNVALHHQEIEDIARALAYLGTHERVRTLGPMMEQVGEKRQWVTMLDQHEVRAWLNTVRQRWDDKYWGATDDNDMLAALKVEFDALVFNDEIQKTMTSYRRDLILVGAMDPLPEDREWLQKEHDDLKAVVNPYARALDKLS